MRSNSDLRIQSAEFWIKILDKKYSFAECSNYLFKAVLLSSQYLSISAKFES